MQQLEYELQLTRLNTLNYQLVMGALRSRCGHYTVFSCCGFYVSYGTRNLL